jgi:hypothetical protein
MRKLSTLLLIAVFLMSGFSQSATGSETITNHLKQTIENASTDDLIRINITLSEQFDSQALIREVELMRVADRREYVISVLKQFTSFSQEGVLAELNNLQRAKTVEKVTTYWIANVINCYATPSAIETLSKRSDIASIDYDEYRVLLDAGEWENRKPEQGNLNGGREITWNVLKINADDVWALGFDGEGIVVSVIDTGVNYDHLDLEDHVWESEEYPNHGYDFVNNDNDPMDDHGHGTHCSGTVAGDGTAGSQTGVAPEATIMCCKVLDAGGGGNESGVWSAIEFSVENGAHVMSLSLGWQHSWGPNRTVWRQAFDASMAAGVLASVAAGNEGQDQGTYPIPDNVRTPGDLPPAWLHPDQTLIGGISGIICIGSTTSSDNLSGFSSRGPCEWENINPYNDYAYTPGMGLIRPDVCAPGSDIKSLAHYSNTGYESGWSGTSMATPANAGMIALMLQKNNTLTPSEICQTIEETTVVLTPGKNNNTGSGRINALAAIEATSLPGPSYYSHSINDEAGNNNGELDPAESVMLTLSMGNFSDEPADDVTVEMSTESIYITITDNTEYFGNFSIEDVIEIEDAFAFDVANNIPGGESIKFILTASNTTEAWESSFEVTANGVYLMVQNFTIVDNGGNGNGSLDPGETADIMIETSNMGQIDAPGAMAMLSSTSTDITINSASFDFGTLEANETATATFNITVDAAAAIGSSVELMFEVTSGYYMLEASFYPKIGLIVEDFETGDFSQYAWEFAGNADWTVESSGAYEGTFTAKSGTIPNSASTEMKLTLEVAGPDTISFYRKVSSEEGYDFLEFYIDNSKKDEWAGNVAWGRVAYAVTEGEHTFRWVYNKDVYVTGGDDCAWVDYIELPAMNDGTMSVNAGGNDESCVGTDYVTNAYAQNYISLMWETSGSGTFDDNTSMEAVYTPSADDYLNGMVTLSLTVYGDGGTNMTDDMELSFMPMPMAAGTISGDDWVCKGGSNVYSTDEIGYAESYYWMLDPAEAGEITGDEMMVNIEWADDYIGMATLTVHGINLCGGGDFSEAFEIEVDDCTGIDDVNSASGISISPNPNSGSFTLNFNSIESSAIVKILNLTGKTVFETSSTNGSQVMVNVPDLENGIYFVEVKTGTTRNIEKLIINK